MVDIPRRLPRSEVSSVVAVAGDGIAQKARNTRVYGSRTSRCAIVFFVLLFKGG